MTLARYNLLASTLRDTFRLLPLAVLASRGTGVEVGPLDDEAVARAYVWVRGEEQEVKDVLARLDLAAADANIDYLKTPVRLGRSKE